MKLKTLALLAFAGAFTTMAQEEARMRALEQQVEEMNNQLTALRQAQIESGAGDLAVLTETDDNIRFGGYGEIHANLQEGGSDQFDIHRFVLYLGYDFSDWIKLTSEVELEHASTDDGYVLLEQLYVDFLFGDGFNLRAGRLLAPLGIINQHHEPTLFYGVERPNVERYIIPSTWSVDGAGFFGSPFSWLSYQLYVVGGLDGSEFEGEDGIRGGRLKGRSSLNDVAFTGRLDLYPLAESDLRIGLSGYYGGTDNAPKGGSNNIDNDLTLISADFEYDVSRFNFRGVIAQGIQSDVQNLPAGTGEESFGWYLEAGVSVMPESWKQGKLEAADIKPFVRYEEYDTQKGDISGGGASNGDYERQDITVGLNLPLNQHFVVKADYQFRDNKGTSKARNQLNFGMGWAF
jgi:hypothetical protein